MQVLRQFVYVALIVLAFVLSGCGEKSAPAPMQGAAKAAPEPEFATILKKAEAGNANGSNVGIVIYYSSEMEDESKVLQLLLLKEYKGVVSKPVEDAKIPEAKTAPMVVVLGA